MSRSERYIPPSDEELERWRQAKEAAKRCDEERAGLLRRALKKTKMLDLVELTLRLAQAEKASQWLLEGEVALDKPVHLLVNDVTVAIDIATRVDEKRINTILSLTGVRTRRCGEVCPSWSRRVESKKPKLSH